MGLKRDYTNFVIFVFNSFVGVDSVLSVGLSKASGGHFERKSDLLSAFSHQNRPLGQRLKDDSSWMSDQSEGPIIFYPFLDNICSDKEAEVILEEEIYQITFCLAYVPLGQLF